MTKQEVKVGNRVKVIGSKSMTLDPETIGREGIIMEVDEQASRNDPLVRVKFQDGGSDIFWPYELEPTKGGA